MSSKFLRVAKGLRLEPKTASEATTKGSIEVIDSTGKMQYYNGTTVSPVVTEAHTATLTNKTIDADGTGNSITNIDNDNIKAGANIALNKLAATTANRALVSDGSGNISASSVTATELAQLSGVSGNLVTEAGTQTLTNKTINADTNTISNIDNNDIKAGANIAHNKMAALTASRALVSDGSGVTSASSVTSTELGRLRGVTGTLVTTAGNQTLTNKVIDGDDNSFSDISIGVLKPVVFDAGKFLTRDGSGYVVSNDKAVPSGTVVGTSDTQTLSNKTFSDAPKFEGATDFQEEASLSSPSAGYRRLGLKTDGKLYLRDSSGNEVAVGTGSGGGINYIDNPDAETATTGYSTYADAAGTVPVDGTGGSASVTFVRNTSSPLRDLADFLFTKGGANRQGEGFSYDFSIDRADRGSVLRISFDYSTSANYVDDYLGVYIYDVTNATLIYPVSSNLKASSQGKFISEFQASSDSTSYRLIFHVATSTTTIWTINFDNISVGPREIARGSVVTDWVAYTPTGSWTLNSPTYTGRWRRVGDSAEYQVKISLTNSTTNSALTFNLASGHVIDTTKLEDTGTEQILGQASLLDIGTTLYQGLVSYSSTTAVEVRVFGVGATYATSAILSSTIPHTWASGDEVVANFKVPIVGWSSNAVISSDFGGREIVTRLERANTISGIAENTPKKCTFVSGSIVKDTIAAYNSASDRIDIKETGFYDIDSRISYATDATTKNYFALIYKNGAQVYSNAKVGFTINSIVVNLQKSGVYLVAGDYIELYGQHNDTGGSATSQINSYELTVAKRSSPQTLMGGEVGSAVYTTNAGGNIAASGVVTYIDFEDKVEDTHGRVLGAGSGMVTTTNTGWRYICGQSGLYDVSATIMFANVSWTAGIVSGVGVYVNGTSNLSVEKEQQATQTEYKTLTFSTRIKVNTGDRIEIGAFQTTAGTIALYNDTRFNRVSIGKVK